MEPTPISNASEMKGPEQINAAYDFVKQGWRWRGGPLADRAALPSGELFNGQYWADEDGEQVVWKRSGGAWVSVLQDTGWVQIGSGGSSWVSGWSGGATSGYKAASYRVRNGVVHVTGVPQKLGTIAANDGAFILPTALRPAETREMVVRQGAALAPARVDSSGVFRVQNAGETSFVLTGSYHI